MKRLLAMLLILGGCAAPAPAPASADHRWTQVFRDDFDGAPGQPPSSANWRYDLGTCYPGCPAPNWGTGEIARMTDSPSNVAVDGRLAITPLLRNGEWTSGRIESVRSDFAFPAGGTLRVEAAVRLPQVSTVDGAGYWPAVWMMGAPIREKGYTGWPTWGELDIMEQVNGRPGFYSAMHAGLLSTPSDFGSAERPCALCVNGFHVYAMELSAQEVRFYLDGEMHYRVPASKLSEQQWRDATGHGFFLILNVAMGGNFPASLGGGPNSSTVDGRPMLVDYIAIYTRPSA